MGAVMQWRAPNKARRYLRTAAYHRADPPQCHLGEMIGGVSQHPLSPMRPVHYPRRSPAWIENGWQKFWGFVFVALYLGFVVAYIWLMFAFGTKPARAADDVQVFVPQECARLAQKYRYPPVLVSERQVRSALRTLALASRFSRDAEIQSCHRTAQTMLAAWRAQTGAK